MKIYSDNLSSKGIRKFAAVAGTVLLLSTGSALAGDLHDTLSPGWNPTPLTTVPAGADFRISNVSHRISGRSPVFEFPCADATAKYGENSAEAETFCN